MCFAEPTPNVLPRELLPIFVLPRATPQTHSKAISWLKFLVRAGSKPITPRGPGGVSKYTRTMKFLSTETPPQKHSL